MQYTIHLKAGKPLRQELQGRTFILASTGAASDVNLSIEIQGFATEELRGVRPGFKLRSPGFTSCLVTAGVDCTVEIVTSLADISINNYSLDSSGAATLQDNAAVAVGDSATLIVGKNGTRRALRIGNVGINPVALGASGITWAKRVIVVAPGDVWTEDEAPNLAWYAITETGLLSSVTAQEVRS